MREFEDYYDEEIFAESFDFTIYGVSEVLNNMGLIDDRRSCREELMERYVFLSGNEQEVYNQQERNFIASVGNILIYRDFYKKTRHGIIPCRVIAAELDSKEPMRTCIFFMKEINKAIGGFSIFFLKVGIEFYVGMRSFNQDSKEDCVISRPVVTCEEMEDITGRLLLVPYFDDFVNYYQAMISAIEYSEMLDDDYESQIIKKRGIQYPYLQMLTDLEQYCGMSASKEIRRYYDCFEEHPHIVFANVLKDVQDELSFVKSTRVNTIEMLFAAEELSQSAARIEEEQKQFVDSQKTNTDDLWSDEMETYLGDPETMIKLLKKMGI